MSRSKKAERIIPCMPVLLDEEKIPLDRSQNGTKFGGTACEYSMATFLLSQKIKPKYSLSIFFISLIIIKFKYFKL